MHIIFNITFVLIKIIRYLFIVRHHYYSFEKVNTQQQKEDRMIKTIIFGNHLLQLITFEFALDFHVKCKNTLK